MNIDVFCCLAQNSAPYAQALHRNLISLQSQKHKIRFFALISHPEADTSGYPKGWAIIPIETSKVHPICVSKPAVNHAKLLNKIEHYIPDDSDVTIITDCDMFMFPHNWDDFIVRKTRELDCIGTEKHDGSIRMFFIAFPTFVYQTLQPDWMPGTLDTYDSPWIISGNGNKIVADTGWKLEDLLIENEKKYEKFTLIDGDYYYGTQLICSHLGGSHKKDFKSAQVRAWYADCKNKIC